MDPAGQTSGETTFTLREFVAEGGARLRMQVVVGGEGLSHTVLEPMCNRPGLALTGFYGFFAWRRLQVIGQAERAYLESLDHETRLRRVEELFERGAYCLIFACGMDVPSEIAALAERSGAVVCRTELLTRVFFHQAAFVLEELRAPKMKMYGTTVEVAGLGVMLEGAPGLGKSETALGLVKHGNARTWRGTRSSRPPLRPRATTWRSGALASYTCRACSASPLCGPRRSSTW